MRIRTKGPEEEAPAGGQHGGQGPRGRACACGVWGEGWVGCVCESTVLGEEEGQEDMMMKR